MNLKKLIILLMTGFFLSPTVAQAHELDVQAGNVRVIKDTSGNISVNTRGTDVQTLKQRSPFLTNWRRENTCYRNLAYIQESTQILRNGQSSVQSTVLKSCR